MQKGAGGFHCTFAKYTIIKISPHVSIKLFSDNFFQN